MWECEFCEVLWDPEEVIEIPLDFVGGSPDLKCCPVCHAPVSHFVTFEELIPDGILQS